MTTSHAPYLHTTQHLRATSHTQRGVYHTIPTYQLSQPLEPKQPKPYRTTRLFLALVSTLSPYFARLMLPLFTVSASIPLSAFTANTLSILEETDIPGRW